METEIGSSLSRIAENSAKLNATADSLTKQVTILSGQLRDLNVGVTYFSFELKHDSRAPIDSGRHFSCSHFLGFGKDDDGKWGIVVLCKRLLFRDKKHDLAKPEDESANYQTLWIRPFAACSRDVRFGLSKYLPQFLSQLADQVETAALEAHESLNQVQKLESELSQILTETN